MLLEFHNPSTQIVIDFITLKLLEQNLLVEFAILIFYTIVAKMPPSPTLLFRRGQPFNFMLPTINHSTEDRDENRNEYSPSKHNRVSIYQRKRFIWISATIIGTLFILLSIKVQTIEIDDAALQNQVASSINNKNRPSVIEHDQDGDVTITSSTKQQILDVADVTIQTQTQSASASSNSSGNNTITSHDHNNTATSSQPPHHHQQQQQQQQQQQRSVRFIPYPYKTLGSGDSVQCQWETSHIHNKSTSTALDFTQQNAYREGVCIPPPLNTTIHIFSSKEAIECLSPKTQQQRNIRIFLSGDSYMKQLYIGLADILLSKHIRDGSEIMNKIQRNKVLTTAQGVMDSRRKVDNATFPFVKYKCEVECYGMESLDKCANCIKSYSGDNRHSSDDVWIVGMGIHIYQRVKHHVDIAAEQIIQFLDTEEVRNRTIYVSPPYYFHRDDYPDQSTNMEKLYQTLLPDVAPANAAHPFLDVFQLTKSCQHENCTFDGGHRSRYVNRWKAQLLLNMLCEVHT